MKYLVSANWDNAIVFHIPLVDKIADIRKKDCILMLSQNIVFFMLGAYDFGEGME